MPGQGRRWGPAATKECRARAACDFSRFPGRPKVSRAWVAGVRCHSVSSMSTRSCAPRRNHLALDVGLACFFVLLDTTVTLAGASWWPTHPDKLAWIMLVLQALADASLVARRRAPMTVIAILTGFTLLLSLLI